MKSFPNVFRIPVLIVVFSIISCAKPSEAPIAIDVLLTLPTEVYHNAIELNQTILNEHPNNFRLDEQHIPHITLLQGYIPQNKLDQVKEILAELYSNVENENLEMDTLQYDHTKKESFASIGIQKTVSLQKLHEKVVSALSPYLINKGTQKSYIQNKDGTPIDQFTMDYVPKFVNDHSFENYNPHISLGVARTKLLDSLANNQVLPMDFRATSMSLYQLGAFGTARKLIWQSNN